jgi:hypothetical protein
MLPKEAQQNLSAMGIDIDALVKAHTAAEEVAIDLPKGTFLTDAQLQERDANVALSAEKNGESKSFDIAKSELKKRGFEIKGNRWGDVVNELNEAINKDKDAKVQQLQEQNALLLKDVDTFKGEVENYKTKASKVEFDFEVMNGLPEPANGLTKKETLEVLRMRGYEPEKADKGVIWKKNGEVLKDGATHAPMAPDKAVQTIFGELKWNAPAAPAGRNVQGTGSNGAGGVSSFSEAKKAWSESNPGKSVISPEFNTFVEAAAKANPAFAYDK